MQETCARAGWVAPQWAQSLARCRARADEEEGTGLVLRQGKGWQEVGRHLRALAVCSGAGRCCATCPRWVTVPPSEGRDGAVTSPPTSLCCECCSHLPSTCPSHAPVRGVESLAPSGFLGLWWLPWGCQSHRPWPLHPVSRPSLQSGCHNAPGSARETVQPSPAIPTCGGGAEARGFTLIQGKPS